MKKALVLLLCCLLSIGVNAMQGGGDTGGGSICGGDGGSGSICGDGGGWDTGTTSTND